MTMTGVNLKDQHDDVMTCMSTYLFTEQVVDVCCTHVIKTPKHFRIDKTRASIKG